MLRTRRSFRVAADEMPNMPSRPVRASRPISLPERVATDGIENEFDAAAIGDFARPHLEILRAVVDQVIDAESTQFGMFGRRCRADDGGANMSCDLSRGNADAAARRMHENGLPPFQS